MKIIHEWFVFKVVAVTLFGEGPSLGQGVTFTGLYLGQIAYIPKMGGCPKWEVPK